MAAVGDEKKRLMQTGVFRTQNDVVTYLLARMIGKSESPVGAWTLKEELEQSGILRNRDGRPLSEGAGFQRDDGAAEQSGAYIDGGR